MKFRWPLESRGPVNHHTVRRLSRAPVRRCHGIDGYGKGMIEIRSEELGMTFNVKSLHDADVRARPDGHIFNTITNGIRNMPSYSSQIPVADRWAIIAYVRALQLSQNVPPSVAQNAQESPLAQSH